MASDDLRFDPVAIQVAEGEVITFVVRNQGEVDHEFVLGNEAYQEQHAAEMQGEDHHMAAFENAVTVAPGETAKLTWRFNEPGEVLYGCHEPGHYAGGMVGGIDVA